MEPAGVGVARRSVFAMSAPTVVKRSTAASRLPVAICETCGIRATIVCNHDGRAEWYFCDPHYEQHMPEFGTVFTHYRP